MTTLEPCLYNDDMTDISDQKKQIADNEAENYSLPPLSDELVYQIIFCMEDQANEYLFDLKRGEIEQRDQIDAEALKGEKDRFAELPPWQPADGFRIMEKFVATLRNPIFRERLRESLSQGRGVFRKFKNVLKEEPAIERLWFYFKEKEIKRDIYGWYERLSDAVRLERLGEPDEDTSELILSDFVVSEDFHAYVDHIREIGEHQLKREFSSVTPPLNELLLQEYQSTWDQFTEDWLMIFVESPSGEFAGFIGAEPIYPLEDSLVYFVKHLYVEPKFRGLGVFKLLTDILCQRAYENGAEQVVVQVSGQAALLSHPLERRGFHIIAERYALDLSRWKREFDS